MKKAIKRLLIMVVFLMTFGLVGCGATLTTNLSISDNFAGSRTMDVSIDKETFDENAPEGGFEALALELEDSVPTHMKFSYEETKKEYVCHFVMSFTSEEDYENQISSILGERQDVEFTYSKSPFSGGVVLKENFSVEDVMEWFRDYLVKMEYVDEDDKLRVFGTVNNEISINGTQYKCNKSCLSVSQKSYIPIVEMNIFTDIDAANEKLARKIELVFDDYVISANREAIESYLISITPKGSVGEWKTEDSYEKFILVIPSCSEEEMTQAMKIFCSSEGSELKLLMAGEEPQEKTSPTEEENTVSYSDMWDEQILGELNSQKKKDSTSYVQPFGFETTLCENLDLSAFVCNSWGEIDSSYYISAKNGKPQSKVYYAGQEEYGWDYIKEKYPEYYYIESMWAPNYQVVSNVNKYYVPDHIQLNSTVKSGNKIVREFVFMFETPFEKSVAKKIETKLDSLFSEHKDLIDVSVKNKKNNSRIIWKISGDVEAVDALCEEIFGMGYSNVDYYCQDGFSLNRQYDYKETIDLRPIFDWEFSGNIDYTLKMTGKVNEEVSVVTGGTGAPADISGKKISYLSTESGCLDARVVGKASNALFFGVMIHLAANVFLFVFAVIILDCSQRRTKPDVGTRKRTATKTSSDSKTSSTGKSSSADKASNAGKTSSGVKKSSSAKSAGTAKKSKTGTKKAEKSK